MKITDTCLISIGVLFVQFSTVSKIPSTDINWKEVDAWALQSTKYFYKTTQFEFKVRNEFSFQIDKH